MFVWSNDPSLPEILRRCANLLPDSAIRYLIFSADARVGRARAARARGHPRHGNAPSSARSASLRPRHRRRPAAVHRRPQSHHADAAARILNGPPGRIEATAKRSRRQDPRLARTAAVGDRESRCLAASVVPIDSEPWQVYKRRCSASVWRAERAIAADYRTPAPARRPAAGRAGEPEEKGARRGRQSPSDDGGVDELRCAELGQRLSSMIKNAQARR